MAPFLGWVRFLQGARAYYTDRGHPKLHAGVGQKTRSGENQNSESNSGGYQQLLLNASAKARSGCGALSGVLGKRNWCIQNRELFPAPFLTPFPADRPVKAPGRQQLVANQNSPPRFWKRGASDNVHGALALAIDQDSQSGMNPDQRDLGRCPSKKLQITSAVVRFSSPR